MPVLPLIDLMILVAWTSLAWAVVHKVLRLALASRFTLAGMGPADFVMLGGVCLLFALALAARVWVKANEGRLLAARRNHDRLPEFGVGEPARGEGNHAGGASARVQDRAATG